MEKRIRPAAQNMGRILGGGMSSEDFIKLMNSTELNCETFNKVPREEAKDFVEVCEQLGDTALAYAKKNEELGRMVMVVIGLPVPLLIVRMRFPLWFVVADVHN